MSLLHKPDVPISVTETQFIVRMIYKNIYRLLSLLLFSSAVHSASYVLPSP